MKMRILGLIAVATLLTPRAAAAQGFIVPFLGVNFGGDSRCLEIAGCEEKPGNYGVAIGSIGPLLGLEEEFGYSKDFFGEAAGLSSSVLTVMSNLIVGPKISVVRPYVVGGVGLIKTNVEFTPSSLLGLDNNGFGWDLGGGVILGSNRVGVRGDIRYFHTFNDLEVLGFSLSGDTKLNFGRGTVGLYLGF